MSTNHTPADDIVYDLVSVQYHALQGAKNNDKYQQDAWRAKRCHALLAQLTSGQSGINPA